MVLLKKRPNSPLLPVQSFFHPVAITPPLPVDSQYSSFSADSDTQRSSSSSVPDSSSAGADDESVSNQDFSDDKGDNDHSPAPSIARRTSIFKNLAPISTLANSETVAPSRLHPMGLARALQTHPI